MKFSIFTPTHDPKHLKRAAESIRAQTVPMSEIEWVVACNGEATKGEVKNLLGSNGFQVKVMQCPEGLTGVGALKRWACGSASGDILVELDHDDELLPTCLQEIKDEVAAGAGFVSSAVFEIREDETDVIYGKAFGWGHAEMEFRGKTHKYNVPFDINARTLCEIYYAPNHVRAWTREAYYAAGGHDASLAVADDHDLLIRTYLAGVPFSVIKHPLYVQHMHGGNTQTKQNADIQNEVARLRNCHTKGLVEEWCRRQELPKFDFGGLHSCPEGWTPVDSRGGEGVEKIDVTHGLPWEDNSVGAIRMHDFLEHIPIGKVVPLMNEIHRVLVPGGWVLSSTPSTDGRGAFQDPTHCSFHNQNSFWYYTRQQQAKYVPEITAKFQAARLFTYHPSAWHKEHDISYVVADLCALKGQRCAGWNGFYDGACSDDKKAIKSTP